MVILLPKWLQFSGLGVLAGWINLPQQICASLASGLARIGLQNNRRWNSLGRVQIGRETLSRSSEWTQGSKAGVLGETSPKPNLVL
jgi:hypothetical protein